MILSVPIHNNENSTRLSHGSFASILDVDAIQKVELVKVEAESIDEFVEEHSLTCGDLLGNRAGNASQQNCHPRKVSFQANTTEYASNFQSMEDCIALWYTNEDFERFRKLTLKTANFLRESIIILAQSTTTAETCWFRHLQYAYLRYCKPPPSTNTLANIRAQATTSAIRYCDSFVGLERKVVETILVEQTMQKDCLYHQVEFWQGMTDNMVHDASKGEMIRTISQELSRPSVGMAYYIANVVAHSVAAS